MDGLFQANGCIYTYFSHLDSSHLPENYCPSVLTSRPDPRMHRLLIDYPAT